MAGMTYCYKILQSSISYDVFIIDKNVPGYCFLIN
jgi:hypothetical protein